MPDFVIAYHGGTKPETQEAGAAAMERWKVWVADLGDAVVNPGTPLGPSKSVTTDGVSDGGGPTALTGFSIVTAADMDAALVIANKCPFLEMGTIEVAQIMTFDS